MAKLETQGHQHVPVFLPSFPEGSNLHNRKNPCDSEQHARGFIGEADRRLSELDS